MVFNSFNSLSSQWDHFDICVYQIKKILYFISKIYPIFLLIKILLMDEKQALSVVLTSFENASRI